MTESVKIESKECAMYRNIRDYALRYTDVDAYDNIKLSSVFTFLEESACASADELGFGYEPLKERGLGFVLVNCYIEFKRAIRFGEKLTVHTWPIRPKHLIFFRDYEIYSGSEKVASGTARWCMIDVNTYSMMPASVFFGDDIEYNTERSMQFANWKIPAATDAVYKYTRTVGYSDYDHYFHLHNTRYLELLMDVYSVDEMKGKTIKSAQITYCKQCKEGEKLDFYLAHDDGYDYIEGKVGDELRVQLRLEFYGV